MPNPNDPQWINVDAGAPAYNARELRRATGGVITKAGTADRFGARSGIFPTTAAAVTASGFGWTLEHVQGCVYPTGDLQRGSYLVQIVGESGTIPANDTSARKDILILRVYDHDEDASGLRTARPEYVTGVPGSGIEPTPSGVANNWVRMATFDVPANTGNPVLTYNAPFVVAVGGILPVRTTAELPTLGLYEGAAAYVQADDNLVIWTGSAWATIGNPTTFTKSKYQACKARRAATQSIPNDVNEPVSFDNESFDNAAMFSPTSDTITITEQAGLYQLDGAVEFAGNTNGYRRLLLVHNGTAIAYQSTAIANTLTIGLTASTKINAAIGDTIRMWVRQNSGGALNITGGVLTHLSVARLAHA